MSVAADPPARPLPFSSHLELNQLNNSVASLLRSAQVHRVRHPSLMELAKAAQGIAEAVHTACEGSSKLPELAKRYIRPAQEVIEQSAGLPICIAETSNASIEVLDWVTVTRPAGDGIIKLFLNVIQAIASMLQIQHGVAYLVRDIIQSGLMRSDPLNDINTVTWLAAMRQSSPLTSIVQTFMIHPGSFFQPWSSFLALLRDFLLIQARSSRSLLVPEQELALDDLICDRLEALFVLQGSAGGGGTQVTAACIGDLLDDMTTLVLQLRLLEAVLQSGAQADPLSTEAMLAHLEPWWSSKTEELRVMLITSQPGEFSNAVQVIETRSDGAGRVDASSPIHGTESNHYRKSVVSSDLSERKVALKLPNFVRMMGNRGLPCHIVVDVLVETFISPPAYQRVAGGATPVPLTPPTTPGQPPAPTPAELLVRTLSIDPNATATEAVATHSGAAAAELPPRPGTLIGREESLHIMIPLLLNNDSTRIWIFGPAGIGKTSVALAAIHDDRVAESFGSNRGFFSCDPFTDLYDLIAGLELYLTRKSSSNPLAGIVKNLRSRTRMLLVLDDFDVSGICSNGQGPAAWHTSFASELQDIPSLRVIFTSRDSVNGLAPTPAWMPRDLFPIRLVEFSPGQLVKIFTNAASGSKKSVPVAAFIAAAAIRDRSDGIPLVPALLGRLFANSPDIDLQMDQYYPVSGPKGPALRRTILFVASGGGDATFTQVLLSVTARLQDGLRPATMEALRSIHPSFDASLNFLKALGLVFVGSGGIIRVSRAIREHLPVALRRLTDAEHFTALHKYFWQMAVDFPAVGWELELKAPRVFPPLPVEMFNLIGLLLNDDAESKIDVGQMDVQKIDAIVAVVRLRRDATTSIKLLERLLSRTDDLPDWEACFHEELGLCYAVQGQIRLAITRMKIATDINKAIGNTQRAAWCDVFLGQLHASSGPAGQVAASACFNKALAVFSTLRDVMGSAHALFQLGTLFLHKEMYDEAALPLETALDLFNQRGDQNALACNDALTKLRSLVGATGDSSLPASEAQVDVLRRDTVLTVNDSSSLYESQTPFRVRPRAHLSMLTFDSGTVFDDSDPVHVAAKNAYYGDDDAATISSFHSHLM